jgi:mono/diheme cytochrome c family protein
MGLKRRGIISLSAGLAALLWAASVGRTQAPASRQTAESTINEYCSDCHSAQVKTAGVVLDPASLAQPGDHAELWERVIRQLAAKSMPPVGNPRPDDAT